MRGPGSALYGSSAFFGVVNVVTTRGERTTPPHVVVSADERRTARIRIGGGGRIGDNGGYWASAAAVRSQGDDFELLPLDDGAIASDSRGADGFDAVGVSGKLWAGDFTLRVNFNQRNKRIPTGAFDTILADPRASSEDRRGFTELRFEPRLTPSLQLYARTWLDLYEFRGDFPYDDPTVDVARDRWDGVSTGGETRLHGDFGHGLTFTVGGEVRGTIKADLRGRDASGAYLREDPSTSVFSGYGVLQWVPEAWLTLVLGGRLDRFSSFGATASPRVAVIARPWHGGVFKVISGRGFRAPSPYELHYNDGGITQVRPSALEPETVFTTDVEYAHSLPADFEAIGGVFYNEVESLIELVDNDEGLLAYRNQPRRLRTVGAEAELRRDWRRGWMLAANYAYQRTRIGDIFGDKSMTNSPEHLFAFKGALPIGEGRQRLAQRLRVESGRETLAGRDTAVAFLWDATLTGDLPLAQIHYAFGIRNLLDWRHSVPGGGDLSFDEVPQSGRSLFVSLRGEL